MSGGFRYCMPGCVLEELPGEWKPARPLLAAGAADLEQGWHTWLLLPAWPAFGHATLSADF